MKKLDLSTINLGQSVATLANIGVLCGLILVAIQINQSTAIARAQLENDYYLADMQLELAMMGGSPVDAWTTAVYSPEKLTAKEAAILDRYFNFGVVQVRRLAEMRKAGLAQDDVLDEQIAYLKWHLGNAVGKRWWAEYKATAAEDEVTRMIDRAMASSNYAQNREYIDALLPPSANQ